jgi:hypothetical protein
LRPAYGYAKSKVMPIKPSPEPNPAEQPLPASSPPVTTSHTQAAKRPLSDAAKRALAEAAARRSECERVKADLRRSDSAKEIAGRGGLDPTRYGDWEVSGLASDF